METLLPTEDGSTNDCFLLKMIEDEGMNGDYLLSTDDESMNGCCCLLKIEIWMVVAVYWR